MRNITGKKEIVNPPAASSLALISRIHPYRRKYIYQDSSGELFDGWKTADRYLTDEKIEAGIFEKEVLGIFFTLFPTSFCVDVDDHTGKGEGYLLSLCQRVYARIGAAPSIVCKTPRGLHCYYYLEYPIHINVLVPEVKKLLDGLPVEVKPTHTIAARIPRAGSLLDPVTLQPISGAFGELILSAYRYHPAEIFGDRTEAQTIRQALKDRKISIIGVRESRTLAKFESQRIEAGQTNQFLCDLIPMYRSAGLSEHEAALRFYALLGEGYAGELRDFNRLCQRVKSFYRSQPPNRFNTMPEKPQQDLYTEIIAENIAALVTGKTETGYQHRAIRNKQATVKKAVIYLENWKAFIDDVKKNRVEAEYWNYLYPFFKKNTAEGYYPISANLFLKIHARYDLWLLPHLKETGYLERSPYGYSNAPDKSTCYHWKMNAEKFII